MDSPLTPSAPSSPSRIGPYDVVRPLGRGGMGAVFLARHEASGAEHAVKVLNPTGGPTERSFARFRREAELLARLGRSHPAIVAVHACGIDGGRAWYAMEPVDGASLAARIAKGPLPPREAAALIAEVAEAVAVANDAGVLHRDLKPDNVLVDRDGRGRVLDFGLAYDAFAERLTQSGEVLGTPSFMAPEQVIAGDDGSVGSGIGPPTDVHGLGATLYAALTGGPPFPGMDAMAILAAVVARDPAPPRSVEPGVPVPLEAICLRALEKDPARRYPDARALAADLGRWLRGEATEARPRGALGRAWRRLRPATPSRRLAAGVAVGALAIALGVVALAFALRATPSDLERVVALEAVLDRGQTIDASEQRWLATLAGDDAVRRVQPDLARRARLLASLAEGGDASSGEELARLVRPGGVLDRALVQRAERALRRAGRIDLVAIVLHGMEPVAIATLESRAPLAASVAAGDAILPPEGPARAALLGTRELPAEVRGGILLRVAERAVEEGDLDAALQASAEAWTSHGVAANVSGWPTPLRARCVEGLLDLLARDRAQADALYEVAVEVEGEAGELPIAMVVSVQRTAVSILTSAIATTTESARRQLERGLAGTTFLETRGRSGLEPDTWEHLAGVVGVDLLVHRAEEELRRPAGSRDAALIAVIALLLRASTLAESDPEVRRTPDRWMAVIQEEVALQGRGAHLLLARYWEAAGRRGRALRAAQAALQADRKRPPPSRLVVCPLLVARMVREGELALERGRVVRRFRLLQSAIARVALSRPIVEALLAAGGFAPWALEVPFELAEEVTRLGLDILDPDAGLPCCEKERDGIGDPAALADAMLAQIPDVHDRVLSSQGRNRDYGRLIAIRAAHHDRHGRRAEALTDWDEAIERSHPAALDARYPSTERFHREVLERALEGRAASLRAAGRAEEARAAEADLQRAQSAEWKTWRQD